jgi:NAD(P)-dependent dehydrogenase (short-subunit alcohol dehydrogenase family)
MGHLDGKVAIITGAGNGIGREHALLFAREGAKVVVNDVGVDRHGAKEEDSANVVVEEIRKLGGEAVPNTDPVGTFESAEKIVKTAVDAFGKLDILVNNAGILRDKTILKTTPEEWNAVIQCHLTGTFANMQAAGHVFKKQGTGGRIINTSSSSGLLGNFGQANYGAAKIGVMALTRIGAWEFARMNVTVNAIAPTALTRMTFDLPGIKDSFSVDEMGPQHIAPMVAFLASDLAAKITGVTFGVDGNQIYQYKMMTSHGAMKRGSKAPWTIDEISQSIDRIMNW